MNLTWKSEEDVAYVKKIQQLNGGVSSIKKKKESRKMESEPTYGNSGASEPNTVQKSDSEVISEVNKNKDEDKEKDSLEGDNEK